jgi:serine/threonine protein kinase
MVLHYAKSQSLKNWVNKNYKDFEWDIKIYVLRRIIEGLEQIHQRQIVHHDFHIGNILIDFWSSSDLDIDYRIYIADMGLIAKVSDKNENDICGVMPYIAPEVLKGNPYTQAADIYSFGMIMYFVATGRQPFENRAHDHYLATDICKGIRPEINDQEAPKRYTDLMNKCWNSNPNDRPNANEVYELIDLFFNCINNLIKMKRHHYEIKNQFKEAEEYRKFHLLFTTNNQSTIHPEAFFTSRFLNMFTKKLSVNGNSINNVFYFLNYQKY